MSESRNFGQYYCDLSFNLRMPEGGYRKKIYNDRTACCEVHKYIVYK